MPSAIHALVCDLRIETHDLPLQFCHPISIALVETPGNLTFGSFAFSRYTLQLRRIASAAIIIEDFDLCDAAISHDFRSLKSFPQIGRQYRQPLDFDLIL